MGLRVTAVIVSQAPDQLSLMMTPNLHECTMVIFVVAPGYGTSNIASIIVRFLMGLSGVFTLPHVGIAFRIGMGKLFFPRQSEGNTATLRSEHSAVDPRVCRNM